MIELEFDWKTPDWDTDAVLYLELYPIGYVFIVENGNQFEINTPWDRSYALSIEGCKVQVETTLSHLFSKLLKK